MISNLVFRIPKSESWIVSSETTIPIILVITIASLLMILSIEYLLCFDSSILLKKLSIITSIIFFIIGSISILSSSRHVDEDSLSEVIKDNDWSVTTESSYQDIDLATLEYLKKLCDMSSKSGDDQTGILVDNKSLKELYIEVSYNNESKEFEIQELDQLKSTN